MTEMASLFGVLTEELQGARRDDGGFGWQRGDAAEPEPTALAALALLADSSDPAVRWLLADQHDDGGFVLGEPTVANVGATALVAHALGPGAARERALDHAVAHRAARVSQEARPEAYPLGWGWTPTTYGWVEPTARVVLALRCYRPEDPAIAEGIGLLREREVDGGGWNYGNADVRGTDLRPYVQTSAAALLALAGTDEAMARRAVAFVEAEAATEPGGLSLAMSIAALRRAGGSDTAIDLLVDALAAQWERTRFLGNLATLAWAAIATGPGLDAFIAPTPAPERGSDDG